MLGMEVIGEDGVTNVREEVSSNDVLMLEMFNEPKKPTELLNSKDEKQSNYSTLADSHNESH